MHKLSVVSLTALLVVGGVLALAVFVNPHLATAAPAPSSATTQTQSTSSHATTTSTTGTNSSLLSQPPTSTHTGDDGGNDTGFDD